MARQVTVVKQEKVLEIAAKLGLNVSAKKGETKIYGESLKRSIAIPNTKDGATRIYCVGFAPTEGTVAHPKPPASTVTVMFDHGLDEKLLLRAIFLAAKSLVAVAKEEPKSEESAIVEGAVAQAEQLNAEPSEMAPEGEVAEQEEPAAELEQQVA
jgi:hypothetical protein